MTVGLSLVFCTGLLSGSQVCKKIQPLVFCQKCHGEKVSGQHFCSMILFIGRECGLCTVRVYNLLRYFYLQIYYFFLLRGKVTKSYYKRTGNVASDEISKCCLGK